MTRWAPQKTDVLDALASEILINNGRGRVIVAVDGFSGTADLADVLAASITRAGHQTFRASLRNFSRPSVQHYAAGSLPIAGRYDLDTLRRVLVDPYRDGAAGSFVLAAFDPERNAPIEPKWFTAKPDALLIVDGEHLLAPELRGFWNYSIWLDTADADAEYVKKQKPRALASAIIDLGDEDHPRRVFADSC